MNATQLSLIVIVLGLSAGGVLPLLIISETRGNFTIETPNTLVNTSFWVLAPMKIVTANCDLSDVPSDWLGAIWVFTEYTAMSCDWGDRGPVATIFPGSIYPFRPPGYHYIYDRTSVPQVPRAQVNISEIAILQEVLASEPNVQVIFSSGDLNQWRDMNRSILCITLYVIVVACALTAAILGVVKLVRIISINGSAFSVSQISLGLISLGSLDLAAVSIYLIARNYLDLLGLFEALIVFLVFADACQTLACLAICVFWYDIMTDISGATKKKISKRIAVPLIVAAIIIVALLLTVAFNSLYQNASLIKILVPAVYLFIALAISISWLVLGTKLLKSLQNKAAVSENKKKMIKKLSNKIFITTALFFGTRVVEVAWTVCELIYTPLSAVLTIALAAIFNAATNAMLSQVFSAPKNSEKEGPTEGVKLTEQNKPLD